MDGIVIALLLLALFLAFCWFYLFQTQHYKFFAQQSIKYLKPSFPFGSFKTSHLNIIEYEKKMYREHGKIYGRFDGHLPVLTIGERDLIDRIMFTDFNKFLNKRDIRVGDKIFDNTLFALEGHDWKRVRNIVKIGFTHTNLKMMVSLLQDLCVELAEKMNEDIKENEIINCHKYFSIFVLRSIGKCAFGVNIQEGDPFIEKSNKLFNNHWKTALIMTLPKAMKYLRIPLLNPETTNFYNKVMSEVVKERKKLADTNSNDFLQRMLEHEYKPEKTNNNSKGLSHAEMLSQCVSFFLAGYEPTTTLLIHSVYRMAVNQDCQQKALDEILRFLPTNESTNECERNEALYSCLGKLKYVEAIMKECLRMCPPMARLERRAEEDYVFPNKDIELKEGFLVNIPVFAIHHDPENYPEPETFNPDRFYPEERNQYKNIFFPFGSGGRECVGKNFVLAQVKLCLLNLLLKFHILPAPTTPVHLEIFEVRNVCKIPDIEVILKKRTFTS